MLFGVVWGSDARASPVSRAQEWAATPMGSSNAWVCLLLALWSTPMTNQQDEKWKQN